MGELLGIRHRDELTSHESGGKLGSHGLWVGVRAAALLAIAGVQCYFFTLAWIAGVAPDFRAFMISGDAANQGLDPYANYPSLIKVTGLGHTWAYPNLNPPVSVLLLQPIALLDDNLGRVVWALGSALLYVGVVLALARHFAAPGIGWRVAAVLLLDGVWSTLTLGQLYMALLVPAALAVIWSEQRPGWAGCCLGLVVAVKPQFALWSLLLACARHWRMAIVSVVTALGISVIPILLGHADWYPLWIAGIRANPILTQFPNNVSLVSLMLRQDVPAALAYTAAGLIVAALGVVTRRCRPAPATVAGMATASAILLSPISWTGYSVFLVPALLAQRRWSGLLMVAVVLLMVPGIVFWRAMGSFVVYSVALVLCIAAFALEAWQQRPARAGRSQQAYSDRSISAYAEP